MEMTEQWLLDEILKAPGTRYALVLSADGLVRTHAGIDEDSADRQAAAFSGIQSICRAAVEPCGEDSWRQVAIEAPGSYLFLIAAGEGSYLGVATSIEVDVEAVTTIMHRQVTRLGKAMTTPARDGQQP